MDQESIEGILLDRESIIRDQIVKHAPAFESAATRLQLPQEGSCCVLDRAAAFSSSLPSAPTVQSGAERCTR